MASRRKPKVTVELPLPTLRDWLLPNLDGYWADRLSELEEKAATGDGDAINRLAFYLADEDVGFLRTDPPLAFEYYGAAVAAGDLDSISSVAHAYLDGTLGVARDEVRGAALLAEGMARGSLACHVHLAKAYLDGRGVKKDLKRGLAMLLAAARDAPARRRPWVADQLWPLYAKGRGKAIPVDRRQKMRWLKVAALDDPDAAYALALEYEFPSDKSAPKPRLAFEAMRRAARGRCPPALHALGWYYDHGFGVGRSTREALRWYTLSRDPASLNNRSVIHSERMTPRDQARARELLEAAAAAGHRRAQRELARLTRTAR